MLVHHGGAGSLAQLPATIRIVEQRGQFAGDVVGSPRSDGPATSGSYPVDGSVSTAQPLAIASINRAHSKYPG